MNYLALPEEAYCVDYIRVVGKLENVIIYGASLLLWYDFVRTTKFKIYRTSRFLIIVITGI